MNDQDQTRPAYHGAYAHNECTKPGCEAKPYESCIWVGPPTERFPAPEGSPSPPHAGRKYGTR